MAEECDTFYFDPEHSSFVVVGKSNSRKTTIVRDIIRDYSNVFPGQTLSELMLIYEVWQDLYNDMGQCVEQGKFRVHQGIPENIDEFIGDPQADNTKGRCLIIDDQQQLLSKEPYSQIISKLFEILAHHRRVHVFLLLQDLVGGVKAIRSAIHNCQYILMTPGFKNHSYLQRELLPGWSGVLKNACHKCFNVYKRPYLILDQQVYTSPRHLLKTGLLSSEQFGLMLIPE